MFIFTELSQQGFRLMQRVHSDIIMCEQIKKVFFGSFQVFLRGLETQARWHTYAKRKRPTLKGPLCAWQEVISKLSLPPCAAVRGSAPGNFQQVMWESYNCAFVHTFTGDTVPPATQRG